MNIKNSYRASHFFSTRCQRLSPWFSLLLVPSLAQAHPGMPGHVHGFENGLLHPLTGLDHICAMIAVGLWAAQCGGRARWLLPATFVSVMILGGALGMGGFGIPGVEQGIAASVLVLGLLTVTAVRLPLKAGAAVVGLFALFHGYAHGVEMPPTASGFTYGLGFVLATISLHLAGIGLGVTAQRFAAGNWIRLAGGAIAACGVAFCLAW